MKIWTVLALLAAGTVSLSAASPFGAWQQRRQRRLDRQPVPERFDIRLGVAGSPVRAGSLYLDGGIGAWLAKYDDNYVWFDNRLRDIYSDYNGPTRTTGAIGIGFDYAVCRWFSVSADLTVTLLWHDSYDSITNQQVRGGTGAAIYLLPRAKFMYMNRRNVRLYGSLGVGAAKYVGFPKLSYSYASDSGVHFVDNSLRPCGEFSPIGIEVGRKFFGFAELGVGTLYYGLQAGIGYKF